MSALAELVRRETDKALAVDCPVCLALAGDVCAALDVPLLFPHEQRAEEARTARLMEAFRDA